MRFGSSLRGRGGVDAGLVAAVGWAGLSALGGSETTSNDMREIA